MFSWSYSTVGMFSRWVFWDASGWVFYIDIFKSGNLEGSSPEREVSADRERRSCLSDSCCEASVIQGENSEGLHKGNLFLPFPPSPWLYCCCSSFFPSVLSSSSLSYVLSGMLFSPNPRWEWTLVKFSSWTQQLIERTDFYIFFFCWAVESRTVFPLQFSPLQYCLPGYLFQETWNWSYERTLIWFPVLCLVPPPKSFLASSYPDAELQKNSFSTKNSGSQ